MKKSEIKIGSVYSCKVSGNRTEVKIDREHPNTGWDGTNLRTGRAVRIKTAARLIREVKITNMEGTEVVEIQRAAIKEEKQKGEKPLLSQMIKKETPKVGKQTENHPHMIIKARAGTGKTTTLVEGLKVLKGGEQDVAITPSTQQARIWHALTVDSTYKPMSIHFCAFNKSIATELQERVPVGCNASTMHSLGFTALKQATGRKKRVTTYKTQNLIEKIVGRDIKEIRKENFALIMAVQQLVSLCKMNLVGYDGYQQGETLEIEPEQLEQIANHYGIEMGGDIEKIFALVPKVLQASLEEVMEVDYDDMIWLPVILDLPVYQNDLLLVDEAQDLNRCQQVLAMKAGRRLILCGDPQQAIYGFAGADTESMNRMQKELEDSERGCEVFDLTVTRRCGKKIVEEVTSIVPDFEAHESAPEGEILNVSVDTLHPQDGKVEQGKQCEPMDGDMILCRVNAPLVSQCFKFLRKGKKANIQGRDIGQGLIRLLKKFDAVNVTDLVGKIDDWYHLESEKESKKKNSSEAKLINLQDKRDCLNAFCENECNIDDIIRRIETIFSDKGNDGILLSSIHRAKGLEATTVFILLIKGATMPHPMASTEWQVEQEHNLIYVAKTRAMQKLVYVTD